MATASAPVFVGWRVVIDKSCIRVVAVNTASQKLVEGQHNQHLDPVASKEQKAEFYSVSMATIRELYKLTVGDIPGLGTGSLYYKGIGACALGILKDMPELINTVNKVKFKNKLTCLMGLGGLMVETQRLVGSFMNIMNNAKVQDPLEEQGTAEERSDSYNLLDRYERLSLVNRIYIDLIEIRYEAEGVMPMAQFTTANNLFSAIDPEGWTNVMAMKNQVDGLIQDWSGLVATSY